MRSQIIITKARNGHGYWADVRGKFGGGYSGATAGETPEAAGLFALREAARFIDSNPEGGDIIAPPEVQDAMAKARVPHAPIEADPEVLYLRVPAQLKRDLEAKAAAANISLNECCLVGLARFANSPK